MRKVGAYLLLVTLFLQMNANFFVCSAPQEICASFEINISENMQEIPGDEPISEFLQSDVEILNDSFISASNLRSSSDNYLLSNGVNAVDPPPPDHSFA